MHHGSLFISPLLTYGLFVCHFGSILSLPLCFFREIGCPHPMEVHPTGGSLRVFGQFSWLEVGSGKAALSRPTQPPVPITALVKCEDKTLVVRAKRLQNKICRSRPGSCGSFFCYMRPLCSSSGNASPPPSAFPLCRGSTTSRLSIKTTAKRSNQVPSSAPGPLPVAPASLERSCARSA